MTASGPAVDPPPRLPWIDVARGLAILMVVAYHALGYMRIPNRLNGYVGVDAFLLLSGFGLALSTRPESWGRFMGRRLFRLLPAYWVVLALCLAANAYEGAALDAKDTLLHVLCLHLAWGDPHTFAVNPSFWFMGLIVPLYAAFALLRPWILEGKGYAALGVAIAVAGVGGAVLIQYGAAWGVNARDHAPHRLATFFVGAALGLMYRQEDPPDRLAREPVLWLGLATAVGAAAAIYRPDLLFMPVAGLAVIGVGMAVAAAGERYWVARPLAGWLAGLGTLAYEWYLCHQYLLVWLGDRYLQPIVDARHPKWPLTGRIVMAGCLALAFAVVVAWAIRWAVAWAESRRTWRTTLPVVAVTVAMLVGVGTVVPGRLPRVRPREFRIAVVAPAPPAAPVAEPVISFGRAGAGDLVFLEHDGRGRARVGIDHWSAGPALGEWLPAAAVAGGAWHVSISEEGIRVRAGPVDLRSLHPPYAPTAKPVVGRNDAGFSSAATAPVSRVERLR